MFHLHISLAHGAIPNSHRFIFPSIFGDTIWIISCFPVHLRGLALGCTSTSFPRHIVQPQEKKLQKRGSVIKRGLRGAQSTWKTTATRAHTRVKEMSPRSAIYEDRRPVGIRPLPPAVRSRSAAVKSAIGRPGSVGQSDGRDGDRSRPPDWPTDPSRPSNPAGHRGRPI